MFIPSKDRSQYDGNSVYEASNFGIFCKPLSYPSAYRMPLSTDILNLNNESYFAPAE